MPIVGTADLPLHRGPVPAWLMSRMRHLASEIIKVIVLEHGSAEVIRRMSDPFWFQAFGCLLGFDWHSSGLTTVVVGAIREGTSLEEHGLAVVGGKGNVARSVPEKITAMAIDERIADELVRASRLSAKVDNTAVQDGYTLYHHAIIFNEKGIWAVVQQGMNTATRYARRYHWLSEKLRSFVDEPHSGIFSGHVEKYALDLTSKPNEEVRKASVDLACEKPNKLIKWINLIAHRQTTLSDMHNLDLEKLPKHLTMPRRIDWETIKRTYDIHPRNYEELIEIKGMGPKTVRALALVSAIIYGTEIDWRDPVKYSFAHGGKDGVPYPVERRRMDKVIVFLRESVEASALGREEKLTALRKLYQLEKRIYANE